MRSRVLDPLWFTPPRLFWYCILIFTQRGKLHAGIPAPDNLPDSAHRPAVPDCTHALAYGCRHKQGCTSFPGKEIHPPPPLRGDPPGVGFTGGFDRIIRKAVLQNTSPGSSKVCAVCDHLLLCATHQLSPLHKRPTSFPPPGQGEKVGLGT